MTYKKVLIDEELIIGIISSLKSIEKNSRERDTVERLQKIIKHMGSIVFEDENDKNSFIEKVYVTMKDFKSKNPDLETRLYILHQDLINDRVTFEKGKEIYDSIMREEKYGNILY